MQIGNQVFEDSRIAAYAVIKGIAVHNWGLKVIFFILKLIIF